MTKMQHAGRVALLMAAAAALIGWGLYHNEATFADGLRYIHRAERFEQESLRAGFAQGIDHPMHPLAIAAAHRLIGGTGPASWQHAAVWLCFVSAVLTVIPMYLLALELFGAESAWLAALLAMVNPIVGYIVVNVLSESTFLLWWTFGLWASVRFMREGRFLWLPLAIGFSAIAYLTRPEGMLLPASIVTTLLLLPALPAIRINWPRWWSALAFLGVGSLLLAGPYVMLKGGIGTKPGIARVLGLAKKADPMGLERERPLPPGQTTAETYRIAVGKMFEKGFRNSVTPPLFAVGILGVVVALYRREKSRAWLLIGVILAASAVGLVRLYATAGYLTVRHGMIPGMILTLASANGLIWIMRKVSFPGRWIGWDQERVRLGPAVWLALLIGLVLYPSFKRLGPRNPGPFSAYVVAGRWIDGHANDENRVLDLTNWSLFFSGHDGYSFAQVYEAPSDRSLRWLVVRDAHLEGKWRYSQVLRNLVGDRKPIAVVPGEEARGRRVQICVYDLKSDPLATTASAPASEAVRR